MADDVKEKENDGIDNLLLGKYQEKILDAELIQFEKRYTKVDTGKVS